LSDYVGAILGLVRDGLSWRLDPLMVGHAVDIQFAVNLIFAQSERDHKGKILPRGEGNVVAVEFNLLYTWHAALSLKDSEWITNMVKHALPGGASDSVSDGLYNKVRYVLIHAQMTQQGFRQMINQVAPRDNIKKWSFGGCVLSGIAVACLNSLRT
jgi:linoleate 10R-lipoxygenase